jgi:uncharacterized membrane protein YdjX (TVP38/TMEM64 family)
VSQWVQTHKQFIRTGLFFLVGVVVFLLLLYLDKNQKITVILTGLGWFGDVLAIILMAAICLTPIPSEGLLIIYMKVFGIIWGLVYAWIGTSISTVIIFLIARYYGRWMLHKVVQHERFEQINQWMTARGSLGLLMARLLPIPGFIVNYAAGLMSTIKFWSYFWTGVVSMIPYYVGAALLYFGVSTHWYWILIGLVPAALVGSVSYVIGKSTKRHLSKK